MKVDLEKLRILVEQKYLTCQRHEKFDLLIWNYTHLCQFEKFWTPETMMCRGLITDLDGNVIARPFKKFFNIGEGYEPEKPVPPLPEEPFEICEKMDGSLGIVYWVGDYPVIATRGSFKSDQAKKANEILIRMVQEDSFLLEKMRVLKDKTLLLEIIFPENRIVVDYGDEEKLVGLAIIDTETGKDDGRWEEYFKMMGFETAKRYMFSASSTNPYELKDYPRENAEGYVLRFMPSGLRVKVKFDEYARLHRLITGINDKRIWEILAAGDSIESMIESVPDEFYQYVKGVSDDLRGKFAEIEADAQKYVAKAQKKKDRAQQAKIIKKCEFPGVGFAMLDGKDYSKVIWAAIKPKVENNYEKANCDV